MTGVQSAKAFLRAQGIPFTEKLITEPAYRAELAALGSRSVPTLVIDGKTYIGYGIHETMVRKALGVPKA